MRTFILFLFACAVSGCATQRPSAMRDCLRAEESEYFVCWRADK